MSMLEMEKSPGPVNVMTCIGPQSIEHQPKMSVPFVWKMAAAESAIPLTAPARLLVKVKPDSVYGTTGITVPPAGATPSKPMVAAEEGTAAPSSATSMKRAIAKDLIGERISTVLSTRFGVAATEK